MIYEILSRGASNAKPGRKLAVELGLDQREFTKIVERERKLGFPICATTAGIDRGYYLAADAAELALYCRSLDRRLKNIQQTRRACGDTLDRMMGQETCEGW